MNPMSDEVLEQPAAIKRRRVNIADADDTSLKRQRRGM